MHVVTCLNDVSRRRQREGDAADDKAQSWQVVDLAAVHHVLEIKTTKRYCLRGTEVRNTLVQFAHCFITFLRLHFWCTLQVCFVSWIFMRNNNGGLLSYCYSSVSVCLSICLTIPYWLCWAPMACMMLPRSWLGAVSMEVPVSTMDWQPWEHQPVSWPLIWNLESTTHTKSYFFLQSYEDTKWSQI